MFINLVKHQKASKYYENDYKLVENMLGFIPAGKVTIRGGQTI